MKQVRGYESVPEYDILIVQATYPVSFPCRLAPVAHCDHTMGRVQQQRPRSNCQIRFFFFLFLRLPDMLTNTFDLWHR